MPDYPRFIVDSMLGHVARWLRLLGYDTLYYRRIEDWKLLKIAKDDDRVLITRDLGLYRRARKQKIRAFFVEDPDISTVLAELSVRFGIKLDFSKEDTRCPKCNTILVYTTSLAEVAHRVNKEIALRYKEFWICPKCKSVYWQGSHWKTINLILEDAKNKRAKLLSRVTIAEKRVDTNNVVNESESK